MTTARDDAVAAGVFGRVEGGVGPTETWQAEKVSIWHAGVHDNPFGMRLSTLMIGKQIVDTAVPMSLLAEHPNVQFNFYRPAIGTVATGMH